MNRNFSQTITFHCPEPAKLLELVAEWDRTHADEEITGYMGSRILADRENLGRYMVIVDFGVIDPSVSAAEEAAINNERPETKAMAAAVRELIDDEPQYHHFDEIYRTD